jgi:uncharacterized protein
MQDSLRTSDFKVFVSKQGSHLFLADGSRIYDISPELAADFSNWFANSGEPGALAGILGDLSAHRGYVKHGPATPPPLRSLSLNLAQVCNMRCAYCYADFGNFGQDSRRMPEEIAFRSIDLLIGSVPTGEDCVLGFMGGEPLLHRDLMRKAVVYARSRAEQTGRSIRFSMTTNATLLEPSDAHFLAEHEFYISVSLDGDPIQNDRFRVLNSGTGSYAAVERSIRMFREHGWPRHLSARATITPRGARLIDIVDHLVSLDFDSVGVAPVLVSPDPALAFSDGDFDKLLEQMIQCGEKTIRMLRRRQNYPFSNLETALREIHLGTHRPHPCGAGGNYLSVSADGRFFACHRLVNDDAFLMGNLQDGLDRQARVGHLNRHHVDVIEPCRTCWARYLCGGGCYHEVSRIGRPGCDYIRGWLDFCLRTYVEISSDCPGYFASLEEGFLSSHGFLS